MNNKDITVIPKGLYCYTWLEVPSKNNNWLGKTIPCPYWDSDPTKGDQNSGCCHYLEQSDWEDDGMGLLWDQVKVCGINDDIEWEIERSYSESYLEERKIKKIIDNGCWNCKYFGTDENPFGWNQTICILMHKDTDFDGYCEKWIEEKIKEK